MRPTATRQQTDLDFRQPHLGTRRRDPIMASKRVLQAAAERRAVDGRDDGFLAAFDENTGRLFRLLVGVRRLAEIADVRTGDERTPLAGNHHRFHGIVLKRRFQMLGKIEANARTQRIHRRIVDGEQRDAIAYFIVDGAQ